MGDEFGSAVSVSGFLDAVSPVFDWNSPAGDERVVFCGNTFLNELIELAGGVNAIGKTVHKYPPVGAEQVYLCGADVIIEAAMGSEFVQSQQRSATNYWSKYKNVPAIENGRIYVVDGDTVSRLGPRLYDGVEMVAKYLRPVLFEK